VQLQVVQHAVKRWPVVALGMEMFQRPFQGVLDDYAAHRIDDEALRSRSGWAERWGYDFNLYRPILEAAIAARGALVALNAPKELTKKVSHHGLESLTPEERAQLPAQIDTSDKAHRAWFDAMMEEMGGAEAHAHGSGSGSGASAMPDADRVYLVQVIWDETMADTAASYLRAHPDARLVILAGNGHCHDTAIVGRIKRRGIPDVVSVRAVIDDDEGAVADALAEPINDYFVVLDVPASARAAR
jgi:uncharacterized iron-regulated protein